jgi:hypothetical protein
MESKKDTGMQLSFIPASLEVRAPVLEYQNSTLPDK